MPTDPHRFTAQEVAPLIAWIDERHAIYMRKEILLDQQARGLAHPDLSEHGRLAWGKGGWTLERLTDDPVMRQYKFCNVFRELDRVTVWIRENIREPFADHESLWFMLSIARFINWPPTLKMMIADKQSYWPSKRNFAPSRMTDALEKWKALCNKVETGAYMIRAENDRSKPWGSWSKQRYVSEVVLGEPWKDRRLVSERFTLEKTSLADMWSFLRGGPFGTWTGWGPFMAGQVVADLRHTRYLRDAPDVGVWAPVSIGSMRGLNRLAGRKVAQQIKQEQGLDEMRQLQAFVNAMAASYVPGIELHDLQNCLCEVDKHLRVQGGEGRPRATYKPFKGDWN